MAAKLALLCGALLAAPLAISAQPTSCQGKPNLQPIWEGQPILVNKTVNGLKFITNANVTPPVTVLHVYGTQYEMGYAYGSLMSREINILLPQVMNYLEAQLNQSIPDWVPPVVRDALLTKGIEFALNLTYEVTKPYTPSWHYETLQGISDGSGISFMDAVRVSMIPELIKASCSIITAWGPATANGLAGGKPVQLRALDWDTDGPFQQFPLLLTFHPNEGNGVPFTTLTWAGLLGAITGMSSSGMGIGEKVWLQYNGVENILGYVWTFLLQDILQFDWDTDQALSRIATANRTCSIWVGLTDKLNNQGKIVSYSNQLVNIYNDKNFPAYPNHDLFPSLIFVNKHVQPSSESCMNDLMHYYYGKLDGVLISQYVTALEQTGDMHIAIYDWGNNYMYVSNAGLAYGIGVPGQPAYTRPFLRFNMTQLWGTALSQY